jgi:nicotinamidase-related amidase
MIQIPADPRAFPDEGLKADEVALLLIDMQRDFLDPGGYLAGMGYDLSGVRAAIEPARRLLRAARGAGIAILHTRQGYRPDLAEVPARRRARMAAGQSSVGKPGPLGRFLIRGEPGFQIIAELAPLQDEPVIDKTANGALWGTGLPAILAARGIRAIIFAGVTTDVCVHSTLRDAVDRGFECLLARDACGSGDAEDRLDVVADVGPILLVHIAGVADAERRVPPGDVVITRDAHDFRAGNGSAPHEGPRPLEFTRPRPLRDVSRNGDDVRLLFVDERLDRLVLLGHRRMSEVQIGTVKERRDARARLAQRHSAAITASVNSSVLA